MFDRFDDAARRSVVMAQEEARVHGASPIQVDHLLLAVLRMADDQATVRALSVLRGTVGELYEAVDAELPRSPVQPPGNLPFDPAVKDVMVRAAKEAQARSDAHIGNEHLLLGIVGQGGTVSSRALEDRGATRAAVLDALDGGPAAGFEVKTTRGLGRFRKAPGGGSGAG